MTKPKKKQRSKDYPYRKTRKVNEADKETKIGMCSRLIPKGKKGGGVLFGLTIGIIVFIFGVLLIPFFTDDITIARDASHLDCSNVSITDGTKLTCLQIDLVVPIFIWFFASLAIGILMGAGR